ncbi:hypothetical protein Tco_1096478, partial [Tanacetum coccineum]
GCAGIGDFDFGKLVDAKLEQGRPFHPSENHMQLFRNRFTFVFRISRLCSIRVLTSGTSFSNSVRTFNTVLNSLKSSSQLAHLQNLHQDEEKTFASDQ